MSSTDYNVINYDQAIDGSVVNSTQVTENEIINVSSFFGSLGTIFSRVNLGFSWSSSRTIEIKPPRARDVLESRYVKAMSKDSWFISISLYRHTANAKVMSAYALGFAVILDKMGSSSKIENQAKIVEHLINEGISIKALTELLDQDAETLSLFLDNFKAYSDKVKPKIDGELEHHLSKSDFPTTFLTFIKAYGKDFVENFIKEDSVIIENFFENSEYYKDIKSIKTDIAKLKVDVGYTKVQKVGIGLAAGATLYAMPVLTFATIAMAAATYGAEKVSEYVFDSYLSSASEKSEAQAKVVEAIVETKMLGRVASLLAPVSATKPESSARSTSESTVSSKINMELDGIEEYRKDLSNLMERLSLDDYNSVWKIGTTAILANKIDDTPGNNPALLLYEIYRNKSTRDQMAIIIGKGNNNKERRNFFLNGKTILGQKAPGMQEKITKYALALGVEERAMLVALTESLKTEEIDSQTLLTKYDEGGWVSVLDYLFLTPKNTTEAVVSG